MQRRKKNKSEKRLADKNYLEKVVSVKQMLLEKWAAAIKHKIV